MVPQSQPAGQPVRRSGRRSRLATIQAKGGLLTPEGYTADWAIPSGWKLVEDNYRGFRVYLNTTINQYVLDGPGIMGVFEPCAKVYHKEISGAIRQAELIHEYRAWLAKGYSRAQWDRLMRARALRDELGKAKWQAGVASGSPAVDEYRRTRVEEIERQLLELGDVENPPLPPVSRQDLAQFAEGLR